MSRKILIICILICLILPTYQAAAAYDRQAAADQIWNYLIDETQNEIISAGIMGYFKRESNYKVDAIPGWILRKDDICQPFTENLYELNRDEFVQIIQNVGGYGLGQWYSTCYLRDFYDYCRIYECKYDNIEVQCDFIIWELQHYHGLWEQLEEETDPYCAGLLIAALYDGASYNGRYTIASMSKNIYKERVK